MVIKIEKIDDGSVTTPKGFKAAGVSCGIKKSGTMDLSMVVSDVRCHAAGVYTTNVIKGASLLVNRENISDGYAQAIVANSGNANACTGEQGMNDAREITLAASDLLAIPSQDILPNSTGVIGEFMPVEKIKSGLEALIPKLRYDGGLEMARAIMTTDTVPKHSARRVTIDGQSFVIGGIAKGSGMIHPNMGTMFGFLTTDATIQSKHLQFFLKEAVDSSFNRFTIDGDTSCDDTVLLLANGAGCATEITPDCGLFAEAFREALQDLCQELIYRLARDGEGVTKVATIRVQGCPTKAEATQIARTIAISPLVKTAMNGEDPNWGRIINAAGYSRIEFNPDLVDLWIGDVQVMNRGARAQYNEEDAHRVMKMSEYEILLNFNNGNEKDFYITTDFSKDYVGINADYRHRT